VVALDFCPPEVEALPDGSLLVFLDDPDLSLSTIDDFLLLPDCTGPRVFLGGMMMMIKKSGTFQSTSSQQQSQAESEMHVVQGC